MVNMVRGISQSLSDDSLVSSWLQGEKSTYSAC